MTPVAPRGIDAAPAARSRGFLAHAGIYGLGALLLQCTSIVLLPVYTHYLHPAEYGVLQFLYRLGDVFHVVLMVNGLRLAVFNFWGGAKTELERESVAASLALLSGAIVLFGTFAAFLTAPILARHLGISDVPLLAAGIAATVLKVTTVVQLALMQARMQSGRFVAATAVLVVSQTALTVVGLVFLDWGVWGVVLTLGACHAIVGLVLTLDGLRGSSLRPDVEQLRGIVRFATPMIPTGIFAFVLHSGDQFFLAYYAGASTLGLYAFAYRISQAVMLATHPLLQVWSSVMYQVYRRPGRDVEFGRIVSRILAGYSVVGAGLLLFQRELLSVVGSQSFEVSGGVIVLLVFAHFFLVATNLFDSALYVTSRTDLKAWVAAGAAAVIACAYTLLIPRHGAVGAALATLIGFAFYAFATALAGRRVFPIRVEGWRIGLLLLFLGAAATLEHALWVAPAATRWASLSIRTAFFLAAPVVAWRLGAISPEEKDFARTITRRVGASAGRFLAPSTAPPG